MVKYVECKLTSMNRLSAFFLHFLIIYTKIILIGGIVLFNPVRRNRNIGTVKQGFKSNNKMNIANSCQKMFYENLEDHTTTLKNINGHEFIFIVEKTKPNYEHACSIDDIQKIIECIPKEDYGDLRFIVLRQPKRKEEIILPVWGRWVPEYTFGKESKPAIIIEAQNYSNVIKWPAKLSVENKKELEKLILDGHKIIKKGRKYIIKFDKNSVRNTQLYRTIPHEFGHYVHYINYLNYYSSERWAHFPKIEKEKFANSYADNILKKYRGFLNV